MSDTDDTLDLAQEPVKDGDKYVTRRLFIIGGVVIGAGLALALLAVVWIALEINRLQEAQIDSNAARIAEVERVQEALRKLTQPTPEEYREQLKQGIKRCLQAPECRRLFPGLKGAASRTRAGARKRPGSTPDGSPGVPESTAERPTGTPAPSDRAPSEPGSPSRPGQSPDPAPEPEPAPQPPAPERPLIGLDDVPVVPSVCVDGVIGINCRQ